MKSIKSIVLLSIALIVLASCSSTNKLTMGVVEPARIYLSDDITKVGIINRSIPSEKNKAIDKIDQILSLEGLNMDREGAGSAITGLSDELMRDSRFEVVEIIEDIEVQRKGLGIFPAALSWTDVENICREKGVDILFSLELYDTDSQASYESKMIVIPNSLGIKAEVPGHRVTINTLIKNGWRVYDPLNKRILDEYVSNDQIASIGEGINPVKAVEAVIGRKEAVLQVSNEIGATYGLNIRPLKRRVSRDYFVRGTDNFVVAKRRAQTGDWDGAAKLWEQELNNVKSKVAGRAYYNMAIINEINGNLEKAMDCASKSYSDYNNKEALYYVNLLKRRMAENRELDRQLSK